MRVRYSNELYTIRLVEAYMVTLQNDQGETRRVDWDEALTWQLVALA
jgi:hypothetical protein